MTMFWGVCEVCGHAAYTHSDTCPRGMWECHDCFTAFPDSEEKYSDEGDTLCAACQLERDILRQCEEVEE
jgi:hypothetical protein